MFAAAGDESHKKDADPIRGGIAPELGPRTGLVVWSRSPTRELGLVRHRLLACVLLLFVGAESSKASDRVKVIVPPAGDNVIPAAWNPFNPPANRINPALEHLRGDIGIQPGLGCANGRCGR